MSSHHIVRDEQEPALLVLDAQLLRKDSIADLLEWSPTVVLPYSQLEEVVSLGYKPDMLLATPAEEKDNQLRARLPFGTKILEVDPAAGVLVPALEFLREGGHKAVNILAESFQPLVSEATRFAHELDIVFYVANGRWLWCRNGLYRKWLTAGSRITVCAGVENCEIQLTGFSTTEAAVVTGQRLELSAITDGIVAVSATAPFFLKEPL